MGRPKKKGKRTPGGRLIVPKDYGNDRVQERRERFALVQGGKAGDEIYDQIGRAWAAGLLENDQYDPAVLRDIGRRYAELRMRFLPGNLNTAISSYEPRSRAMEAVNPDDPAGRQYLDLDARLRSSGFCCLAAVRELVVTATPDEESDCPWVARLVTARLAKQAGDISDHRLLGYGVRGLMAMAGG